MDSKALFIKQVTGHMNSLCELLGCPTGEPAGVDVMARGMVGTRMLAGTAALMNLNAWEELLQAYHALLDSYHTGGHPWDERVAGVTGELVEREEHLANAWEADPSVDVARVVPADELVALITEVEALREECGPGMAAPNSPAAEPPSGETGIEPAPAERTDSDAEAEAALSALGVMPEEREPIEAAADAPGAKEAPSTNESPPTGDAAAVAEASAPVQVSAAIDGAPGADDGAAAVDPGAGPEGVDLTAIGAEPIDENGVDLTVLGAEPADDVPLAGVIERLRTVAAGLTAGIDGPAWRRRDWASSEVRGIRSDLGMLAFCASSIERAVRTYAGESAGPAWCSLEVVSSALDDFVRELARESGRDLTIAFEEEGISIDAELLPAAESIVQWMIADVFERSEAKHLAISVNVSERYGAMHWRVSDDGDNRVTDSRLDHEDQPAFYPRLRHVIRMLARHHGALWVEPSASRSRFEFTLPVTHHPEPLLLWGGNGDTFAVRASQLCQVVPSGSTAHSADSYGEYLDLDGSRVPLVRLDDLFGGAPSDGDMIAVVGTVEKRVAFYVPDCGERATGRPDNESVSIWKGPAQHVVRLGERRVPLLDADDVLTAYLSVTGSVPSGGNSGGAAGDDLDGVQSQATAPVPGAAASPGSVGRPHGAAAEGPVDVVVVEQSESLREELAGILTQGNVRAAFTTGVDEAMNLIRERAPRLVISEFRMPSMAARQLVDRMHEAGTHVPVLVTTSQSGKTADLLVEKLGVSGYLSKPLNGADVVERVEVFLEQDVPAS